MKKVIVFLLILIIVIFVYFNYLRPRDKKIEKMKNDFKNRTVVLLGDSLIDGYLTENGSLGYFLKEKLPDNVFINKSRSGSTITTNTGDDTIVIKNQISRIEKSTDPDLIILNGGVNDAIGYSAGYLDRTKMKKIGKASNLGDEISDSVMTDFEEVLSILREKFPDTKIIYLQMCLLDDDTLNGMLEYNDVQKNEMKKRFDALMTEIPKSCKLYGVEFIDVSNVFSGTGLLYRQNDFIHIKDSGYNIIVSKFVDIISKVK